MKMTGTCNRCRKPCATLRLDEQPCDCRCHVALGPCMEPALPPREPVKQ